MLTLHVDGTAHEHRVHALGQDIGLPGAPSGTEDLPPDVQQARTRVGAFLDAARGMVECAGQGRPHVPEAFTLRATPATAVSDGESVQPQVLPWPLPSVELAAAGVGRLLRPTRP